MTNLVTVADVELLSPSTYSVYKHTTPNGKCYIGITYRKPESRWQNGAAYKRSYFGNAIQKYGWNNIRHEILCCGLDKVSAEQKEREFISFYRSDEREYGYNISNGGTSVGKHSESTKSKISATQKGRFAGEKNPRYGVTLDEETKRKISEANKGRKISEAHRAAIKEKWKQPEFRERMRNIRSGENNHNYGKHHSEETRRKISEATYGHSVGEDVRKRLSKYRSIAVAQYSLDGEKIRVWESAKKAETELGIFGVSKCCVGNAISCGGYIWRHANEEFNKYPTVWSHERRITQFDLAGNLIKLWNSAKQIKEELGFDNSHIGKCCKRQRNVAYGYMWKYAEVS